MESTVLRVEKKVTALASYIYEFICACLGLGEFCRATRCAPDFLGGVKWWYSNPGMLVRLQIGGW